MTRLYLGQLRENNQLRRKRSICESESETVVKSVMSAAAEKLIATSERFLPS
jgi:hypothetical protein